MKKCFLFIILFLIQFQVLAQTNYEEGYIIDNTGTRKEVLILNRDWRTNPSGVTYKTAENASPQRAGTDQLSEFGVGDEIVFRKFSANIDRSSERVRRMSTARDPQFSREEVFLKLLVDGEAELYQYREGEVERFFYSLKDVAVKPLVHRKYLEDGKIATNNSFRQQLYENLKCGDLTASDVRQIDYEENELVQFFEEYNTCLGADPIVYRSNETRGDLNLYVKAAATFASMDIEQGLHAAGNEIDLGILPQIGAELEHVLPFNRNKWSVFMEGAYLSYSVEEEHYDNPPHDLRGIFLSMDMDYISAAAGIRHYFFVGFSSAIFVNAAFAYDVPLNTHILLERRDDRYELEPELTETETGAYAMAGVGFSYSGRLSAELRYILPRTTTGANLVHTHYDLSWKSRMNSSSVIFSYRLF